MSHSSDSVSHYLQALQRRIVDAVEAIDGKAFTRDAWQKDPSEPLQGRGLTCILEDGAVFERAGCGFSQVSGASLPPSATHNRPELAGCGFEASGVSLVFHPQNPFVPTVHMNVRMLRAQGKDGQEVCWFGGGMDLTPYYGFEDDARHFHQTCQNALAPFGAERYPAYKKWCDDYFFLKHRNEQRGIGGIFYDDVSDLGFDGGFALMQSVGDAFLNAYLPIVEKRRHTPFTPEQREFQLYRRGRYVEFNLVFDRGTHFGLQSGGRTESILLSMPRQVSWAYQKEWPAGSPERELTEKFLVRRDWLGVGA